MLQDQVDSLKSIALDDPFHSKPVVVTSSCPFSSSRLPTSEQRTVLLIESWVELAPPCLLLCRTVMQAPEKFRPSELQCLLAAPLVQRLLE